VVGPRHPGSQGTAQRDASLIQDNPYAELAGTGNYHHCELISCRWRRGRPPAGAAVGQRATTVPAGVLPGCRPASETGRK